MMQDVVTAGCRINVRDLHEGHIDAGGIAEQQLADQVHRPTRMRIQENGDVEDPVAVVGLPDAVALVRGADRVKGVHRIKAPAQEICLAQANRELRHTHWRLELDLGGPRNLTQFPDDVLRDAVELSEIVAEDIYRHRRGEAGNGLLDSRGEEGFERKADAGEAGGAFPPLSLG